MIGKTSKTKIIFTVGPATSDVAMLEQLIRAGVDICRINMAHADHAWTREIVANVNLAGERAGRQIATLMDVKGPEIRTGDVPETFELEKGEILRMAPFTDLGTPVELVKAFGGKAAYQEALVELETELYKTA